MVVVASGTTPDALLSPTSSRHYTGHVPVISPTCLALNDCILLSSKKFDMLSGYFNHGESLTNTMKLSF
jgi:hypothetical protein